MTLDPVQARVLGTLIEKEIVTPEAYPLSLNALLNGCNQKSSREPVMELTEEEVRQALHQLEDKQLISTNRDSRVPKFEHRARTVFQLRRDETAILCLLLLRGPQTPGELRSRADRMFAFEDIGAVESALNRLSSTASSGEPGTDHRPLVAALPRQPGSRELRYMHLLCGPIAAARATAIRLSAVPARVPLDDTDDASKAELAARVKELEGHMDALRAMMRRIEDRLETQTGERGDSPRDIPE